MGSGTVLFCQLMFAVVVTCCGTVLAQERSVAAMLRAGDYDAAATAAEEIVRQNPGNGRAALSAADTLLRSGRVDRSIELFDLYLKGSPEAKPYLWQRGIALAFAGRYKLGAEQFEVHREVNPHDVENPAWHFLCVAKADSIDQAKKLVLPAPNDGRVPMEEIHRMLTKGDVNGVKQRLAKLDPSAPGTASGMFYGTLYLGLYADALGQDDAAIVHLKKCAKDAPRNYMGDVARVYAKLLTTRNKPAK